MHIWRNVSTAMFSAYSPTAATADQQANPRINAFTRTFFILAMVISILGNLLVIVAIFESSRLRSLKSNKLLCNLAIADFLQGAVAIPMRIVETYPNWTYLISCRVSIPFSILFGGTSNITILFVSFERFLSVYFPFLYAHYMTGRSINLIIVYSWFSVGILSVMSASPWCWKEYVLQNQMCSFPMYLTNEYIWTLYVYVHLIPITCVLLIYGFILKASCVQHRQIYQQKVAVWVNQSGRKDSYSPSMAQGNTLGEYLKMFKSVKVVTAVAGLFIFLVSPIIIIDVMDVLQRGRPAQEIVNTAVCMIYANNFVNVFVYAGLNKDFRQAFKKILTKMFHIFTKCKTETLSGFT